MPGFTTHYLFGVKNLKQFKNSVPYSILTDSINKHRNVFYLGLQGPDIFFFQLESYIRRYNPGSMAHRKCTSTFLKALIQTPVLLVKEEERQIARAYAAGFLGHYILDAKMHPYVYSLTGHGDYLERKGYGEHIALESDIDTSLLMRYGRHRPSEFPQWKVIAFGPHTRGVVANILYEAYSITFPNLSLSKSFLYRAIWSMQMGTKLIYNPHHYKRQLFGKAEKLISGKIRVSTVVPSDRLEYCEDPLNLQHKLWKNPWKPAINSTESVPQMIQKASKQYQKAFCELAELYDVDPFEKQYDVLLSRLRHTLGRKSYHTGFDWRLGE